MDLRAEACDLLQGEITLPGDKSISHRALILAAIAHGQTRLFGLLIAQDTLATVKVLRDLGVAITLTPEQVIVQGVGFYGLKSPHQSLNCGNSGTTMRLLAGLLAAQPFPSTLVGDSSLQKRPMARIVDPLQQMGASIQGQPNGDKIYAPLKILPGSITGIHYELPIASAQVKSCLLLAGLYAKAATILIEKTATRDHSEHLLRAFGVDLTMQQQTITLQPGNMLTALEFDIPGDISSAAFFIVAATLKKGSHVQLRNVGVNPLRTGIITILQQMGAQIQLDNKRQILGEWRADIVVRSAPLKGITLDPACVASCIDEFPLLFIAAAAASGQTILQGLQELRFKESDRIATMAAGLIKLGIPVTELPDGIIIQGATFNGGWVNSAGDHRVAMAFAIAGAIAKNPIFIRDCANITTSFPNFMTLANQLGLSIAPHS